MKHEFVANSCRICLTQTKKLRSLYKPIDEGEEPPNEMLHLITGIQVEELDEHETLPKNICKNCELSLSMAFEFRDNALKTHQIIIEYLKQLHGSDESNEEEEEEESDKCSKSNYKKEYEEIMDLEPLDCVDALEDDMQILSNEEQKSCLENNEVFNDSTNVVCNDEGLGQDENEFYKQHLHLEIFKAEDLENENLSDHIDNQNQAGNDDDQEDESQEQIREYHIEQMQIDGSKFNSKKILNKTNNSTKTFRKINSKIYKLSDKISSKFTETNSGGRKRSNMNNKDCHICDICGNVFAKLGRMKEHRQRHDKELRYSCEICEQKFLTRELLRKHMFSHSGGKPLKCKYCSRTFYYESVRRAHEAIHQGHKPYVCDVCDKAFGYAHALKKHKLIHDEIKLYRCEYCNKNFRLQHHMKQHEMTKLHQNTVRFANSGTICEDSQEFLAADQDLNNDILFIEEIADEELDNGS